MPRICVPTRLSSNTTTLNSDAVTGSIMATTDATAPACGLSAGQLHIRVLCGVPRYSMPLGIARSGPHPAERGRLRALAQTACDSEDVCTYTPRVLEREYESRVTYLAACPRLVE